MKQLARRASLVVVLLLASVGTASAECAWVLWQEQTHYSKDGSLVSVDWIVVEAMSEQTCRAQVTAGKVYEADPKGARATPGIPRATFRKVCLPDTVDPRGPKR